MFIANFKYAKTIFQHSLFNFLLNKKEIKKISFLLEFFLRSFFYNIILNSPKSIYFLDRVDKADNEKINTLPTYSNYRVNNFIDERKLKRMKTKF